MKLFTLLIILGCLSSDLTKAQNLVPNPGFENYKICPEGFVIKTDRLANYVENWRSANMSTPDYFHRCSDNKEGNAGVPENWAGYMKPHSGDAYVGIDIWNKNKNEYREYIQTRLKDTLTKGQLYEVTFYYAFASGYPYYANSIGACITNHTPYQRNYFLLNNYKPQVAISEPIKASDIKISDWNKFQKTFVAEGGEEVITIGNFNSNNQTHNVLINEKVQPSSQKYNKSYFFIDDVQVIALTDEIIADRKTHETLKIDPILFKFDQYKLPDDNYEELKKLALYLKNHPGKKASIYGHTDQSGPAVYNKYLSEKRAAAVKNFLQTRGAPSKQLETIAKGEQDPLNKGQTKELRQENRRVEIKINDCRP